ncbi:MAG: hypothetical protein ACYCTL_08445 [Acidimicrobiales bacterium]
MRFPRLTHRVALGMGAIGLVLASGGAATAAVSAIQPAGALSAQVPAVGVREQNVNSAGRIRVALPKGSLGVSGSVSVSNLPENSAGRVKVQNGSGATEFAQAWNVPLTSSMTVVNATGSGIFKDATLSAYQDGNAGCAGLNIWIDGQMVFNEALGSAPLFGVTNPVEGGANPDNGGNNYMYFTPTGGLPFHKSLVVQIGNWCQGQSLPIAYRIWYTAAS